MEEWVQKCQYYESEVNKLLGLIERNKKQHNEQVAKITKEFEMKEQEL